MIIRQKYFVHLGALLFVVLASITNADVAPLPLSGPTGITEFKSHSKYLVDDDWSLTPEVVRDLPSNAMIPLGDQTPGWGYTKSKIWLATPLHNTIQSREWVVHYPENFKQVFHVFVLRSSGEIEPILTLNPDSPFSDRPLPDGEMAAPFQLEPQETVTLLLASWSGGSNYIEFSLMPRSDYEAGLSDRTARNFLFYGMMTILIVAALISLLVLRNPLFLAYSGYALSGLLYVMHGDGTAFQLLWPNAPLFNSGATVWTGSGIIIFGSVFARMFLSTATHHPILDKMLLGLITGTVVLIAVLFIPNQQLLKKLLVMLSLVAMCLFALGGAIAALTRFKEVRFYLFGWVGAVISATMLNLNHVFGFEIDQAVLYDSMRAVMVFDAAMMGLAIADRYRQLRQSQQRVLEESLDQARRNLDLSERLSKLEASYQSALDMSETRDQSFRNTVHDLRQPLHSLRLTLHSQFEGNGAGQDRGQIDQTFAYLERLIGEHLTDTVGQTDESSPTVEEVLHSVHRMFRADAEAKGLRFNLQIAPVDCEIDRFDLMRIVSNLVSNAINATDHGAVGISSRQHEGSTEIEVWDTGPGLPDDVLADAAEGPDVDPDGHGQGLSIALRLARAGGCPIEKRPTNGPGTRLVLRCSQTSEAG